MASREDGSDLGSDGTSPLDIVENSPFDDIFIGSRAYLLCFVYLSLKWRVGRQKKKIAQSISQDFSFRASEFPFESSNQAFKHSLRPLLELTGALVATLDTYNSTFFNYVTRHCRFLARQLLIPRAMTKLPPGATAVTPHEIGKSTGDSRFYESHCSHER